MIVDTTVWVDYLRGVPTGQTGWLEERLDSERLGLTDLILCEVLQGVTDERKAPRVEAELRKFEVFATGGIELALVAASNYRSLRGRGFTVKKTIDCLIASFCLMHQHSLLHNDKDYCPFENLLGLRVIHP